MDMLYQRPGDTSNRDLKFHIHHDEGRVFINVLGNVMAAVVVGKWEKDFDPAQARDPA